MSEDIPSAWHPALERKGIAPSYRALGDRAGISHETARRVVTGRSVKADTVARVADALGVDAETVYGLRSEATSRADVWEPPPRSSLLTEKEREALSRLINVMTAGRRHEDGEGDGQQPAPMTKRTARRAVDPGITRPARARAR